MIYSFIYSLSVYELTVYVAKCQHGLTLKTFWDQKRKVKLQNDMYNMVSFVWKFCTQVHMKSTWVYKYVIHITMWK